MKIAAVFLMLITFVSAAQARSTEERIFSKSPFIEAAKAITEGDTDTLEKLIKQGLDVNYLGETTRTPWGSDNMTLLLWATISDYPDSVEMLLKSGADPNLSTSSGMTPLIMASGIKRAEPFELLVKYKADPNKIYEGPMKTALMLALREKKWDRAERLLKQGADINLDLGQGDTALTELGRLGSWDSVYWLLEHGADYEKRDSVKATVTCSVRRSYRVSPRPSNSESSIYRDKVRDWLLARNIDRSRVDPSLHPGVKCDD